METVVFATLVLKVVDFLRQVFNFRSNVSAIATQAAAWIGGVILVVLGAHASATEAIVLPGVNQTLGALDGASQVLVGLLVASLASTIVDVKQAIDGSDSAAKPPLLSGGGGAPPAA